MTNHEIQSAEKPKITVALEAVLATRPETYVNSIGEPVICLPAACGEKSCTWPLKHQRTRAEIAGLAWNKLKMVLSDYQITSILRVLESFAWRDQRGFADINEALDNDVFFECVVLFMNQPSHRNAFSGSATNLLTALKELAKRNGFDMKERTWPNGPAQLSLRLNEFSSLLREAGIEFNRGRDGGKRRFIELRHIHRPDGVPLAPSRDKPFQPNLLRQSNDNDDAGSEIFDRIDSKEHQ